MSRARDSRSREHPHRRMDRLRRRQRLQRIIAMTALTIVIAGASIGVALMLGA